MSNSPLKDYSVKELNNMIRDIERCKKKRVPKDPGNKTWNDAIDCIKKEKDKR